MSAVYSFIHYKFVNTEFADYNMQVVRAKWEAAGMGADQMEKARGICPHVHGAGQHRYH